MTALFVFAQIHVFVSDAKEINLIWILILAVCYVRNTPFKKKRENKRNQTSCGHKSTEQPPLT